jgi:hypothetical protein
MLGHAAYSFDTDLLFGLLAFGLFSLEERGHRDQQAKYQEDDDLGHRQTEDQALAIRR